MPTSRAQSVRILNLICTVKGSAYFSRCPDVLANKIADEADFLAQNSRSARAIVDLFKKCDREIKLASGNMVDLKIVLAMGIIGVTVLEVGATTATPIWLTLTIFSVNHAIEMHQPHRQAAAVSAPVVIKAR
jgi:hypothetical protein